MMNTIKKVSIQRFSIKIVHGIVKSDVLSHFHSFKNGIKIQNILHCLGVTKKDPNAGIGDKLIRG